MARFVVGAVRGTGDQHFAFYWWGVSGGENPSKQKIAVRLEWREVQQSQQFYCVGEDWGCDNVVEAVEQYPRVCLKVVAKNWFGIA